MFGEKPGDREGRCRREEPAGAAEGVEGRRAGAGGGAARAGRAASPRRSECFSSGRRRRLNPGDALRLCGRRRSPRARSGCVKSRGP